ncbi:MAG: hypothetical protein ACLU37_09030 [Collinsella sp.]
MRPPRMRRSPLPSSSRQSWPILTGWVDKKFCQSKEDLSPAGVEAIEEAVATDIDGE